MKHLVVWNVIMCKHFLRSEFLLLYFSSPLFICWKMADFSGTHGVTVAKLVQKFKPVIPLQILSNNLFILSSKEKKPYNFPTAVTVMRVAPRYEGRLRLVIPGFLFISIYGSVPAGRIYSFWIIYMFWQVKLNCKVLLHKVYTSHLNKLLSSSPAHRLLLICAVLHVSIWKTTSSHE